MSTFLNTIALNLQRVNLQKSQILKHLLKTYDKVMVLKMFVDTEDNILKNKYYYAAQEHNDRIVNSLHIDAGFDLFAPGNDASDIIKFYGAGFPNKSPVNKLDFKVCCSAKMYTETGKTYNTGYYMYPRSSLSKTQLRLANSTGIIDAGYRGHLIGMFDVANMPFTTSRAYTNSDEDADYIGYKYERYLQICAPALNPIIVEIVDNMDELGEETARGDGGFGSTGGIILLDGV